MVTEVDIEDLRTKLFNYLSSYVRGDFETVEEEAWAFIQPLMPLLDSAGFSQNIQNALNALYWICVPSMGMLPKPSVEEVKEKLELIKE